MFRLFCPRCTRLAAGIGFCIRITEQFRTVFVPMGQRSRRVVWNKNRKSEWHSMLWAQVSRISSIPTLTLAGGGLSLRLSWSGSAAATIRAAAATPTAAAPAVIIAAAKQLVWPVIHTFWTKNWAADSVSAACCCICRKFFEKILIYLLQKSAKCGIIYKHCSWGKCKWANNLEESRYVGRRIS